MPGCFQVFVPNCAKKQINIQCIPKSFFGLLQFNLYFSSTDQIPCSGSDLSSCGSAKLRSNVSGYAVPITLDPSVSAHLGDEKVSTSSVEMG